MKSLGYFVLKTGKVFKLDIFDGLSLGKTDVISPRTTLFHFPRFLGDILAEINFADSERDTLYMYKLIEENIFWLRFESNNFGNSDGFYAFIEWRNTSGNINL